MGIDTAGWDKIWAEAYKRVKEDPKNANLLTKFELFLESRGQIIDPGNYKTPIYFSAELI